MTYVLLHMFAGSARSWDAVVPLLDGPCVVPDLPGFGGVPDAAAGLVDWVSALIQPHPAVVLVGHSMGGKLAMAVAARRPANLVRLVLLAPSPPTPEPIPDRAAMLAAFGDPAAAADTARQISARAADPAVLGRLVQDSLSTSRQAWTWWVQRGSMEDIAGQAAMVAVPTTIAVGAQDETLPPALQRQVQSCIAGASLSIVPGSRHALPIDRPDAAAAAIMQPH